jgi:N-acetylmuramoyl-L-alanine amidase
MRRALLLWLLMCGCEHTVAVADAPPPLAERPQPTVDAGAPVWPQEGAPLKQLALPQGHRERRFRVLVDAGHGSPGNEGNTSLHCEKERDVMRDLAFGLATRLSLMGPFEVRLSREGDAEPSYAARRVQAESWPADAVVSLHSDARGAARPWLEGSCISARNDDCPGFSVLWSSEAKDPLARRRRHLAWAMTDALAQAGFKPYLGEDYEGLYLSEPEHPGSFINDETSARRIWFLRTLAVPTVIIETHHALDYEEVARWREMRTRNLFASAVAKGLLDYFGQGH